jgi:hypothetical protein
LATVTLARSDLFPVGTTVALYPANSKVAGQAPTSAAIASASAAVDAAGLLTISHANVESYKSYVAYALVNGEHRYATVRSTADAHGSTVRGKRVGTTWPAVITARRTADGTS